LPSTSVAGLLYLGVLLTNPVDEELKEDPRPFGHELSARQSDMQAKSLGDPRA
jgi:hypothetical protein